MASRRTRIPAKQPLVTVSDTIDMTLMRPQQIVPARTNLIIALGVFLLTMVAYILTQAHSLSFWDAGEYITCSSILGVPHPPGNPFYILLGRFFCAIIPGLPHAAVVNFLSGLMSALAVMFLYLFTVKLASMYERNRFLVVLTGLLAAFYCAFSYTYWTNAIEAEVYAGLALVLNLIMYLTLLWVQKQRDFSHQNLLLLIVYIFFLGFCIHQTSLQIGPAVLFIAVYPMLLKNIKTLNFWTRTGVYFVILLAMYALFDPIGKGARVPDLSKWVLFAGVVGILIWHMREKVGAKAWWLALLLLVIGLTPHFFLMVRAAQRPFINEGIPSNLHMFTNYVLRRQYGVTSFIERRFLLEPSVNFSDAWNGFISEHLTPMYAARDHMEPGFGRTLFNVILFPVGYIAQIFLFFKYFSWQFFHAETIGRWLRSPAEIWYFLGNFTMVGLGVGGFVHQFRRNKHSWVYLAMLFFWSSLAMVAVMNLSNTEVRARDYFFTNAYYLWGVWMAIGSVALVRKAWAKRKALGYAAAVGVCALCLLNMASMWFIHDRTEEIVALDYGQNFLNGLEEDAIVFTNGDNDTFPLWYVQAVHDPLVTEHIWPKRNAFPTAVTDSLQSAAIAYKQSECNGIRLDVSIANLSLLNTDWYPRQLRDKEGIEFHIPDSLITPDILGTVLSPQRIRRDIRISEASPAGNLRTDVIPSGTVLNTAELATLRIVKDNWGKRPIYFAVTIPDDVINRLGLTRFLRNEGMVDRLVAEPGQKVDMDRLLANIDEVYQYRGIDDDTIYKDDNALRLLGNYGHAFIIVASQTYMKQGDYDSAIHYMEEGLKFVVDHERLLPGLAQLYMRAGRADEARAIIEEAMAYDERDIEALYLELAQTYAEGGQTDMAVQVMEEVIAKRPNDATLYVQLAYAHLDNKAPELAFDNFNRVSQLKPNDKSLPGILFNAALEAKRYDLGISALEYLRVQRGAAGNASDSDITSYIGQLQQMQAAADTTGV